MAIAIGSVRYLTVTEGNNTPGLYYYSGSGWEKVVVASAIEATYPPISIVAGKGISLAYDIPSKKLTISLA